MSAKKLCSVCGDRAVGMNFNVITCESCKVLFRRNALKYESFKCHFNNNCTIDVLRRKFCKRCRLNKCFAVGMKKEWIMNDEEKKMRKVKIEENRKKRLISKVSNCWSSSSDSNTCDAIDFYRNEEIIEINDKQNHEISEDVYKKSVEFEFSFINSIARPFTYTSDSFTDIEVQRMIELTKAVKIAINSLTKLSSDYQMNIINKLQTNPLLTAIDISNLMAIHLEQIVQKLVKFCKNINSFKGLTENDQVALIKYGGIEICTLRSVRYFNFGDQYWTFDLNNKHSIDLKLDSLKQYNSNENNTYLNHKSFLAKIGPIWDSDDVIIDLLTAITLFNPDRPKLIHKELQQHVYMFLLQRYLTFKYRSECVAKTQFLRLLNCLTELPILNRNAVKKWLEIGHKNEMPLMSEICDQNLV